jgi:integrase
MKNQKKIGYKTPEKGISMMADGRYRLRVSARNRTTGRRESATRTLPANISLQEAQWQLQGLRQALVDGSLGQIPQSLSVSDYCEQWLKVKASRLRHNVAEQYVDRLVRHILPHLGHLPLANVTRREVEAWVAWAERAQMPDGGDYAGPTLAGWWRLLTQVLKDAAAEYRLPDPTLRVRPPRKYGRPKREQRTLDPAQFKAFLAQAQQLAPERMAEIATMAMTGMRAGEVYGLEWTDIDWAAGVIHVQRSASHGRVTLTKTGDPREVPLKPELAELVQAHRAQLQAQHHRGLWANLVFPSEKGGHRVPQSLHKVLKTVAARAGLPVKVGPQVLRRTFNTLMLGAGVDQFTLRAMMGHTTAAMTQRYAGVPHVQKQAAVAQLPLPDLANLPGPKASFGGVDLQELN